VVSLTIRARTGEDLPKVINGVEWRTSVIIGTGLSVPGITKQPPGKNQLPLSSNGAFSGRFGASFSVVHQFLGLC
jgi:hypothetical protein